MSFFIYRCEPKFPLNYADIMGKKKGNKIKAKKRKRISRAVLFFYLLHLIAEAFISYRTEEDFLLVSVTVASIFSVYIISTLEKKR